MFTCATEYFEQFGHLLTQVITSDATGISFDVNEAIRHTIALIRQQAAQGRKIMFVGNGGSAAIASHQAVDYWKNGGLRAMAFNDASLLTCISNDYGYASVFEKPIQMFAESGDVLIAISSSGMSVNILNAVAAARQKDCPTITLSGFSPDNHLRKLGDINFYVPSHSYGYVEIAHLMILHCTLDTIMKQTAELHANHVSLT
jgi:D-sedoheptulose 7-phosphate isomerase